MYEFLASPQFKYVVYPLLGALLGIAIKFVTRNDLYAKFKPDDLGVGLDLIKTAALTFLVTTSDKAAALIKLNKELEVAIKTKDQNAIQELAASIQVLSTAVGEAGWVIAILLILLWSTSTLVRKMGWKNGGAELNYTFGIGVPLFFGVGSLSLVMAKAI